jgi:hypothetical protein
MSNCRIWVPILALILLIAGAGSAQATGSNKEVLPAQAMSGIVMEALETGKILLASNDKIMVVLKQDYGLKPGDALEIFQPLDPKKKEDDKALYKKIGLGIVIEKIDARNVLCIIESSSKEISLGDLVRVVVPR